MKRLTILAAAVVAVTTLKLAADGARDASAMLTTTKPVYEPAPSAGSEWTGVIWDAQGSCSSWTCVIPFGSGGKTLGQLAYERTVTCRTATYATGSETMCARSNGDGYWVSTSRSNGQVILEVGSVVTNSDGSKTIKYAMVDSLAT